MCDHFWRTVEEPGYGWVSVCEECGKRESAEHSENCQFKMDVEGAACYCGAQEEFEKYERRRRGKAGGMTKPDGYIRKIWLFREIAVPLGTMHAAQGHVGWNGCACGLAEILRKLDAAMLTKQKRRKVPR